MKKNQNQGTSIIKYDDKLVIYCFTCNLVLMTSIGVLPNTEHAPARAPNAPTIYTGTGFLGSPSRYQFLRDSITKNLMAWLEPCFSIVGTTPWYTPFIPEDEKSHIFVTLTCVKTCTSYNWGVSCTGVLLTLNFYRVLKCTVSTFELI